MNTLLAFETATEACSVALWHRGGLLQRFQVAPRGHADLVLGMAESLLSESGLTRSQVDAVAFGRGPGSFTGVRIATGVVQGIAFALDVPVIPVSTLAALAQGAYRERGWSRVMAAIDARMGEVYVGAYAIEHGIMVPCADERVAAPEAVCLPDDGEWCGAGTGWGAYAARLPSITADGARLPQAQDVAILAVSAAGRGEGLPAEMAAPVYLRDDVVHKKGT